MKWIITRNAIIKGRGMPSYFLFVPYGCLRTTSTSSCLVSRE